MNGRHRHVRAGTRPVSLLVALSLGAAAVWWPLSAYAASSDPEAAAPEPEMVCASATRLVSDALPQRAIALIQAAQETSVGACASVMGEAARQVEEAAYTAGQAQNLLDDEKWAEAEARADEALDLDQENEKAEAIRTQARNEAADGETDPEKWFDSWTQFREDYLDPGSGLIVPMLVVVLTLLLLARLSTSLTANWPQLDRHSRVGILAVGLLSSATAGFLATRTALEGADRLDLLSLAATALVGVGFTGWALATRLRLNVTVVGADGKDNPTAAGHVVALLSELGADRPRGLEVPQGADVEHLDGAFSILPDRAVLKALSSVFQGLVGLTPWRVRVTEERPELFSVQITRNGRSVTSAVIDADSLGVRLPRPGKGHKAPSTDTDTEGEEQAEVLDLHRLAAAVVVTTLARHHDGFEGLSGATDWRGLGLHYIATTDLLETGYEGEMLARAVEYDPGNLLAQVAWRHAMYRTSGDDEDLRTYVEWLTRYLPATDEKHQAPLRQRMLHSRAAAAVNYYYANGNQYDPPRSGSGETRVGAVETKPIFDDFVAHLTVERRRFHRKLEPSCFQLAARPAAAAMALWASETSRPPAAQGPKPDLKEWLESPAGPDGHYNAGCYYATRTVPDVEDACRHLRLAGQTKANRHWLRKDPQLKGVLTNLLKDKPEDRKQLVGVPSTDLLSLPTLKPFAKKLRAAGATDLLSLRRYLSIPLALDLVVGWDVTVVRQILLTVALADSVPDSMDDYRVELCRELIERGHLDLVGGAAVTDALAADVTTAIQERFLTSPDAQEVQAWLETLRRLSVPGPRNAAGTPR